MNRLIVELQKNFKLIFRNWSSLVLIIIAPLLLILFVGYSFSGQSLHDIKLGVIADSNMDVDFFTKNMSSYSQVIRYQTLESCLFDLKREEAHLCIKIQGTLQAQKGQVPQGEIKVYYDNTRKRVSLLLLNQIKEFFGLTAEQISLISTKAIFSNLQDLSSFLDQSVQDLETIKQQALITRADLVIREQKLIELHDRLDPATKQLKVAHSQVHIVQQTYNQSAKEINDSLDALNQSTQKVANLFKFYLENNTIAIKYFNLTFGVVQEDINQLSNLTNQLNQNVISVTSSLDNLIRELDVMNLMLIEEIKTTNQSIRLIDESIEHIDQTMNTAKERIEQFGSLDPDAAQKITRPLTQSFKSLLQNLKEIQISFPLLLSTIIVFISLLFSTILTLLEIHNKAYARNILAPINDIIYTLGLILTTFSIILVQVIVLLLVGEFTFAVPIFSHLTSALLAIMLLMSMFIFAGMIIAYISKNIQTAILLATFSALGFFLLSNALIPLEAMPPLAAKIANFNPVTITNGILRGILFYDFSLSELLGSISLLVFYFLLGISLLYIVSKRKNKRRV